MRPNEILALAGLPPGRAEPLHGGDMGEVSRVRGDGWTWVVKSHARPPAGLFPTEAAGLRTLAEAGARVPEVRWSGEPGLVLSYLPPGPADWAGLARMLAGLHRVRGDRYGSESPIFLGNFRLPAGSGERWGPVWTAHRIRPLLTACRATLGRVAAEVDDLLDRFEPATEGPCLVHGDLWSGNVHMSRDGAALIDPSVWWAERSVDLAMMRLFGGFPPAFWTAYRDAYPIPAEVEAGVHFHQLYFLLVHVHFFGRGYVSAVQALVDAYRER